MKKTVYELKVQDKDFLDVSIKFMLACKSPLNDTGKLLKHIIEKSNNREYRRNKFLAMKYTGLSFKREHFAFKELKRLHMIKKTSNSKVWKFDGIINVLLKDYLN